jgi:hypothetical protein
MSSQGRLGSRDTYSDQVANQLHFLEQKTDHDEASVVAQLLHHQIAAFFFVRFRVISSGSNCRVKAERFVQIVCFARTKTDATKVKLKLISFDYHQLILMDRSAY